MVFAGATEETAEVTQDKNITREQESRKKVGHINSIAETVKREIQKQISVLEFIEEKPKRQKRERFIKRK